MNPTPTLSLSDALADVEAKQLTYNNDGPALANAQTKLATDQANVATLQAAIATDAAALNTSIDAAIAALTASKIPDPTAPIADSAALPKQTPITVLTGTGS